MSCCSEESMGNLTIENNKFIYEERERKAKKVLLDCNDYFSNKSRIPMHSLDNDLTIPGLLLQLFKWHNQLCANQSEDSDVMEALLMDILLTTFLIKTPMSQRVLEIGCTNGVLSYHLATLLGRFNVESALCCVCNKIGNSSDNSWLDMISLVGKMPGLSMLASDYDAMPLEPKYFDIVIINGTEDFEEPYPVIGEAKRLVKDEGIVMCYADCQPLLESSFKLSFPDREEYSLTGQRSILVTCV